MQQFYRVTPVYCKGNYIVLPKGYNSYKLQFMVHTMMSRVIYNPGNIIRYCQVLTYKWLQGALTSSRFTVQIMWLLTDCEIKLDFALTGIY